MYLRGSSGSDFYYTHLGSRNFTHPQRVRIGQVLGTVGNYAKWGGVNHIHLGVRGGPITIMMVWRAPQIKAVK